jgi:hypothetical protein
MFPVWHNSKTTKYQGIENKLLHKIACVILVLVLVLIFFCLVLIPFVVHFSNSKDISPSIKQTKYCYFYMNLLSQIIENLGYNLTKYKTDEHITQILKYVDHIQNVIWFHHDCDAIVPTFCFSWRLQNSNRFTSSKCTNPKAEIVHVHHKHIEPQTN